ncbi:hypothetical protein [uncultured Aquimarina sp.]|uniref:hypothetical protein n=1 Tax=uncultured Aquimarina sp. TaxID=575652 RepID=UPI0026351713|nr:hypothetical protein [uncultured Aquimarina sp.]
MKPCIFIVALLFFSALSSQTIERTVIGSSGTTLSNASVSLDFTVGELMVTTLSNGTTTLNQGFHQELIILQLKLSPVIFLQGPLITSGTVIMDDSLRSNGLLPTTSPYADSVTCEATVFDITGNNAIVDWVWVSLLDKNDPTVVLASQSAFVQADGDIVSVDGTSALAFDSPSDSYYIAINHRNHIAVMSANTVALNTSTATTVNLSDTTASVFGDSNSVVDMGNGIFAMIAGDFDENGQIQNTDTNAVIQLLGISGYSKADMDMNGQVQNSDINGILNTNIGKGVQF